MRIAHIIIAHKNPLQMERLLKKMQHPNFDFYIHIDKKVDIKDYLYLAELEGVYFIRNRVICNWGGYSTLKSMIASLREVLTDYVPYDYYNLLSGQDYPLKSNEEILDFFERNATHSFIFYETKDEANWWKGAVDRFQKYHLTDYNFFGKFFIEVAINLVLPKRKFPIAMELYGGSKSSWWSLTNEAAVYLAEFLTRETGLTRFLRFSWGSEEFVVPTVLLNSPFKSKIVNNNLRYIEFPAGKPRPKILDVDDLDKMLLSDMLFARKFDITISTAVLDEIDRIYLVKSGIDQ